MRVLVIEDFDLLRDSIAQGLREEGFAVDTAADGEEGLWHAKSGGFDVIILDLMLPKLDGLSLLKQLRRRDTQTHVLVLTAKDTTEDKIKGLDLGADDYLVKPFRFEELIARVRALVRRKYEKKSPVIRISDLEIDTLGKLARRGGETIALSAREYALLEYLALREGQVVSRTEIWEHVYDFASEADSNVVDVNVGHLRKKIEKADFPKLIHTRRGLGYMVGRDES
jgi:DNA-binding response OmpR family regulator